LELDQMLIWLPPDRLIPLLETAGLVALMRQPVKSRQPRGLATRLVALPVQQGERWTIVPQGFCPLAIATDDNGKALDRGGLFGINCCIRSRRETVDGINDPHLVIELAQRRC
jgi:hypothetical protein